MPKRKLKKPTAAKVKRVKLEPKMVLVVEAPKGIVPVMVPHPARNAVEIVPVPVKTPGKSWWRWRSMF